MIVRTDALVLRSMKYGETSRIVTLFTREKGKVAVMARGARLTRSRFGATLQPLAYIQCLFYYKPTRDLQTLSETTHLEVFHGIGEDLEKLSAGLRMVELVQALLQPEEQNPLVFNLLLDTLRHLDAASERPGNLLPHFQLKLGTVLGFAPDIDRARVEAVGEEGGVLALESGAILPLEEAPPAARRASRAALRAFAICARADAATVLRMRATPEVGRELDRLVADYLRFHLEEAYPDRSSRVIEQLLRAGSTPPPSP
ncbi:MAG: DNA repair protein RecO [Bacteroidetes bacterium]|nr:DNA repair protein RecO [Rhodothermaceae bacterium RA]RMH68248.1 MAG: DNA repair protein RecO [Bacteroidota bacterium]